MALLAARYQAGVGRSTELRLCRLYVHAFNPAAWPCQAAPQIPIIDAIALKWILIVLAFGSKQRYAGPCLMYMTQANAKKQLRIPTVILSKS